MHFLIKGKLEVDLSNITVNKQSSIRIAGSKILYFDAFEVQEEKHDADYIFITHEHYDHFDSVSISKVMKGDSVVIAPESMKKKLLKELQIEEGRCIFCMPKTIHELNQIWVETIPAYNNLKPFHTKGSKWVGYLVKMDGITYYIAGDTDANEDVKKVKCDVALIPIDGHYTMDKRQAADLISGMKPKAAIPTHYGEVVGSPIDGSDFKDYIEIVDNEIQVELKL